MTFQLELYVCVSYLLAPVWECLRCKWRPKMNTVHLPKSISILFFEMACLTERREPQEASVSTAISQITAHAARLSSDMDARDSGCHV